VLRGYQICQKGLDVTIAAKGAGKMLETSGAVAVITGGGSGIGEAIAKAWVKQGGKVVLADVVAESLSRVEKEIRGMGGEVVTTLCDVTKESDNEALAALATRTYEAINLVVPCAGIAKDGLLLTTDQETGKVIGKMSLDQFRSVVDINLTGVFLTIRECAAQMVNLRCKGLICLVSSVGSLGTAGQINYSSTKAAMSAMPKVVTAELFRKGLADRIRCVAIAPGYVGTAMVKGMNQKALEKVLDQIPIKRLVEPEEVASLVIELYQNEALAGEVFYIHGGLRLGSRG
jgi:3-oxoacyl-[acyl-carrier protein] reductase